MMLRMRYALAGLALLAVLAAGAAYGTRESSRTKVPAIELLADAVGEPKPAKQTGAARERKKESAAQRGGNQRGAAPVRSQAPAPAGDDDGDDDGD